ncbi:hypothetical protein [Sediminicola sp. 1XM1-17]|uniref:hypothetical protein n=1 Tax=Sediminicola sp. 1XM1-17 TaxID=3127702 RepID=UPI0030772543
MGKVKSLAVVMVGALALQSCKMNKEESGSLPDVDVHVEADSGELPEYDIAWSDIEISTTTKKIKVPKVVVVMEEEEVEVPVIDFDMPGQEKEERSLVVEAEVSGTEHELNIMEIRATKNRLYVISKLQDLTTSLGNKTMRIQDQVYVTAPDLDVQHIIVGKKADRVFNNNYKYATDMTEVDVMIGDAKTIYSK